MNILIAAAILFLIFRTLCKRNIIERFNTDKYILYTTVKKVTTVGGRPKITDAKILADKTSGKLVNQDETSLSSADGAALNIPYTAVYCLMNMLCNQTIQGNYKNFINTFDSDFKYDTDANGSKFYKRGTNNNPDTDLGATTPQSIILTEAQFNKLMYIKEHLYDPGMYIYSVGSVCVGKAQTDTECVKYKALNERIVKEANLQITGSSGLTNLTQFLFDMLFKTVPKQANSGVFASGMSEKLLYIITGRYRKPKVLPCDPVTKKDCVYEWYVKIDNGKIFGAPEMNGTNVKSCDGNNKCGANYICFAGLCLDPGCYFDCRCNTQSGSKFTQVINPGPNGAASSTQVVSCKIFEGMDKSNLKNGESWDKIKMMNANPQ